MTINIFRLKYGLNQKSKRTQTLCIMNFIIIFCLLAPIKTLGASENEDNVEIDATVETSGAVIDNSNVIIDETINNEASYNQKQLSPVEKGTFYLLAPHLYN